METLSATRKDQWNAKARSRLLRFYRESDRSLPEYDQLTSFPRWPPVEIVPELHKADAAVLFTKQRLCHLLVWANLLPKSWRLFIRGGPMSKPSLMLIRDELNDLGVELFFVGDLDPLDLNIFVDLAGWSVGTSRRSGPRVHHLGVNDPWMQLCRRSLPRGFDLSRVTIPLGPLEVQHLRFLESAHPGLAKVVGERAFGLLRGGRKFELEGAASEAVYGKGFLKKLANYMQREVKRLGASD